MLANKRMLTLGAGALVSAVALAACSSGAVSSDSGSGGASGGNVTLNLATVNNGQMKDMEQLKTEYEKANPGTTVNFQVMEEGDLRAAVTADVASGAGQYDIVIPYFHFGIEYVDVVPQWAVDGARAAIDAGATLVVTNHPHVIQGMEIYAGKPIIYSVGNFIFDQMFSVQTRQGLILELVIRGNRCVGWRTRGVEIEDFNQPRLMTAGEHAAIMEKALTF